jgi:hypothetical protein
MKKLELNIETVRRLDGERRTEDDGSDRRLALTHKCTATCNHTTCEVC